MSAFQITTRELRALTTSRPVWTGIAAVGVILGLAGPFGTAEALWVVSRIAYWLVVSAIGFFLGSAVATLTAESLRAARVPMWPSVFVAGTIAGLVNFAALLLINWLVFRLSPANLTYLLFIGGNVVVISIIIASAYVMISNHMSRDEALPTPPRILERLPFDKRGDLVSLSVEDHYTEVVTTKGRELILIRLADAMAETGDTPGLQVHRSHWVALDHVTAARRDGARAILTLTDGRDIPVSRTYVPAIKEAGLLPK